MNQTDRWLLPDAIEEVLPPLAMHVEQLRRQGLDRFARWGYQQVIPPQAEFLESLHAGMGGDLDLLTCKVTDQLSGRMLGITPDLTQQVARMDAHSMPHPGVARYCYCAPVLHARKASLLSSRNPLQIGAEVYGSTALEADLEIICLMAGLASDIGLGDLTLDIGHVGLFRALTSELNLPQDDRTELFSLMRQRALPELNDWLNEHVEDDDLRSILQSLPGWSGSPELLDTVADRLQRFPVSGPIEELRRLTDMVRERRPELRVHIDLAELRDFNYHTGLVFSLFHSDHGHAIAKGGRYDDTGRAYGRSRPATGFSADLKTLAGLTEPSDMASGRRVYIPVSDDAALVTRVDQLRGEGEILVQGFTDDGNEPVQMQCTHTLAREAGGWHIVSLQSNANQIEGRDETHG